MGFRSRSRVLRGLPLESGQDSSADSAAVYVGRLLTRSTLHEQPACDVACVFSCNRLATQRPRESCRRCSWSISSGTITETPHGRHAMASGKWSARPSSPRPNPRATPDAHRSTLLALVALRCCPLVDFHAGKLVCAVVDSKQSLFRSRDQKDRWRRNTVSHQLILSPLWHTQQGRRRAPDR